MAISYADIVTSISDLSSTTSVYYLFPGVKKNVYVRDVGNYKYVTTLPSTADGLRYISASTGGWVLESRVNRNFIRPEDFGAVGDGTTSDDAAWNSAISTATSAKIDIVGTAGKTYRLTTPKTFDLGLYSVIGNGCILDFSGLTDGLTAVTLTATSSITPAQIAIATFARSKFTGLTLLGPGKAGAGAAYSLTSKGLVIASANLYPDHITVCGFGYGVYFSPVGVYICTLSDFAIEQNKYGVYGPSGGSDYGEKLSIVGGVIGGNAYNVSWHIPTGRLSLYDVSVDYPGYTQIEIDNSGEVVMFGGWYECDDAGSGAVTYTNSGSLLQFNGTHFQLRGTPGAFAQAALGTTASGSTTKYENVFMFNTQNTADILDNGAGRVRCTVASSYGVPYLASVVSSDSNLLMDPSFTSSSIPDLWYASGGTTVNRLSNSNIVLSQDTSVYYSGSASLKCAKAGAYNSDGFGVITPIKSNCSGLSITGKYHVTSGSNGGVIYCTLAAYKLNGVNSYGVPVYTAASSLALIGLAGTTSEVAWASFGFGGMSYSMPYWADAIGLYFNPDPFSGTVNFDDIKIYTV